MRIVLAWRFTFTQIIRPSGVVVSHIGCFKAWRSRGPDPSSGEWSPYILGDIDFFGSSAEQNTDWKSQVPATCVIFLQGWWRYVLEDRRYNVVRSKCECPSTWKYHVHIMRMAVWRETKLLCHDIALSVYQVTRQQCALDTWPKSVHFKPRAS